MEWHIKLAKMSIDSGQKIFLVPVSLMAFEGQEMSPNVNLKIYI
jgi:hypothetical protein